MYFSCMDKTDNLLRGYMKHLIMDIAIGPPDLHASSIFLIFKT